MDNTILKHLQNYPLTENWNKNVMYLKEEIDEITGLSMIRFGGIVMQADQVNKNQRLYPLEMMRSEVNKFNQMIQERKAIGELDHPDDVEINLDRVSHRWTKIEMRGKNVYGEAVVLPTPCGKILEGLLKGGVQLGVSSRASGSLSKGDGYFKVSDFDLAAIDVVFENSAPDASIRMLESVQKQNNMLCKDGVCYMQEDINKEEDNIKNNWKLYFHSL